MWGIDVGLESSGDELIIRGLLGIHVLRSCSIYYLRPRGIQVLIDCAGSLHSSRMTLALQNIFHVDTRYFYTYMTQQACHRFYTPTHLSQLRRKRTR